MPTSRNVVVCLGPGRSGTSMTMQLLVSSGLRLSSDLVGANDANPMGAFEDLYISQTYKKIYETLDLPGYSPIPSSLFNVDTVKRLWGEIESHSKNQIMQNEGTWGFKDPRTSLLLGQWIKWFNRQKVVPHYILCYRNIEATIKSCEIHYGMSAKRAQIQWLNRMLCAIHFTGGNVFAVDYDVWFSETAAETLDELCTFTGLPKNDSQSIINSVANPRLDRSRLQVSNLVVSNGACRALSNALENINGPLFEHPSVLEIASELYAEMDARQFHNKRVRRALDRTIEHYSALEKEVGQKKASTEVFIEPELVDRLKKHVLSHDSQGVEQEFRTLVNQQQTELANNAMELERAVKENDALIQKLKDTNRKLTSTTNTLAAMRSSKTWKMATAIRDGIIKPGVRTLLIPISLLRILISKK